MIPMANRRKERGHAATRDRARRRHTQRPAAATPQPPTTKTAQPPARGQHPARQTTARRRHKRRQQTPHEHTRGQHPARQTTAHAEETSERSKHRMNTREASTQHARQQPTQETQAKAADTARTNDHARYDNTPKPENRTQRQEQATNRQTEKNDAAHPHFIIIIIQLQLTKQRCVKSCIAKKFTAAQNCKRTEEHLLTGYRVNQKVSTRPAQALRAYQRQLHHHVVQVTERKHRHKQNPKTGAKTKAEPKSPCSWAT